MPIVSYILDSNLQNKTEKIIKSLIEDEIILGIEPGRENYDFFFLMAIQFVPKIAKRKFAFGKPEGIRIFINSKAKVFAAVDFLFYKKGVKLSHIYQGPPLKHLVNNLKKVKLIYFKRRNKAQIELIQFFYTKSQFLLVKEGRTRTFFRITGNNLNAISLDDLKMEINSILNDPPLFEN